MTLFLLLSAKFFDRTYRMMQRGMFFCIKGEVDFVILNFIIRIFSKFFQLTKLTGRPERKEVKQVGTRMYTT